MAAKPPITANQVTLLRLLLLPIGAVLMYSGITGQWLALGFMTIVGCTDFVDGWLARRYGSTELGRLMDPIADKVFIVVAFMPYIDLKWLPAWAIGLLLWREYVITGLRSAYERRHMAPKTLFLAKVKTWAQMAGCGVMFMLRAAPRPWMIGALAVGFALPILLTLVIYLAKRYFWRGALIFSGWVLVVLLVYLLAEWWIASQFLFALVIGITWLSGWGYIAPALPVIWKGTLDGSDWVRVLGGLVVPVLQVAAIARPNLPSWAIILIMSQEMAVGGLDNLLCYHNAQSPGWQWGLRVGLVSALTALALWGSGGYGRVLIYLACAVSLICTTIEFVRGRRYYLDEPAAAAVPAAPAS